MEILCRVFARDSSLMTMYVVNEQTEIRSGTLDLLGRHSIGFDLLAEKSFDLISQSSLSSAGVELTCD